MHAQLLTVREKTKELFSLVLNLLLLTTSAPMGAWKCNFPCLIRKLWQAERPANHQPGWRRRWGFFIRELPIIIYRHTLRFSFSLGTFLPKAKAIGLKIYRTVALWYLIAFIMIFQRFYYDIWALLLWYLSAFIMVFERFCRFFWNTLF